MKKANLMTLAMGTLALVAPCGLASATDPVNTYTKDVTLGEVDETIYSVDIHWGDMTFDWKYNEFLGRFKFQPQLSCFGVKPSDYNSNVPGQTGEERHAHTVDFLTAAANLGHLYTDEECSAVTYDSNIDDNTEYFVKYFANNQLSVADMSVNGRLSATASFKAEDNYDWVDGKFADLAFNNEYQTVLYYDRNGDSADLTLLNPEDQIEDTHSLAAAGGYAPAIILNKYFFLQQKSGTAVEGGSVTAGDKIGTITVTISPDTKPITE